MQKKCPVIILVIIWLVFCGPAFGQNYPSSLDTTTTIVRFDDFRQTYLNGAISNSATSATVGDVSAWSSEPVVVQIGLEFCLATKTGPTTVNLTRGIGNSTAAAHPSLASVRVVWSGYSWNPLRNAVLELQAKLGVGSSPAASASTGYLLGRNGSGQTVWDSPANWGITADALLPDQTGNSGKYLTTNGSTVSWATVSGGSSTFLALTDTPSSFSGQANKFLRVNGAENALEFATISGGGDLLSTNNLSDLTSASTARTNLGLGTIATQSSTALSGSFDFGGFKLKQETSGFALTIDSDGDDFTANRNLSFFTGDASRSVTLNGNLTVSSAATVSGTNSGDQTITLTGDVTGSGTGSFSTTIAAGTVTFAKMADLSTARLIGRTTAGTGAPEEVRFQGGIEDDGSGNLQVGAFTGDVTKSAGDSTLTIANDTVSYAKMQNVTFQRVLGRNTFSGSPGDVEEVSVSSLLDWVTATEGAILYRGASGWDQIGDVYSDGTDLLRVSDNSPVVFDADVRGGAADLNSRLGVISNFASPNAGGIVSGQYYDNAFQGTASSTLAGAANRMDLAPYYTSVTFAIDRIGVAVSTGVASAQAKVVIYSSDANGWPDALLYETAALDCSSTGIKEESLSFTFYSGTQYWVGVRHSSTATLRTINVSSAKNLGLTSATASNYATILRRTLTFATAATDPWVFTNSDRVANVTPPSIRFRAQ